MCWTRGRLCRNGACTWIWSALAISPRHVLRVLGNHRHARVLPSHSTVRTIQVWARYLHGPLRPSVARVCCSQRRNEFIPNVKRPIRSLGGQHSDMAKTTTGAMTTAIVERNNDSVHFTMVTRSHRRITTSQTFSHLERCCTDHEGRGRKSLSRDNAPWACRVTPPTYRGMPDPHCLADSLTFPPSCETLTPRLLWLGAKSYRMQRASSCCPAPDWIFDESSPLVHSAFRQRRALPSPRTTHKTT